MTNRNLPAATNDAPDSATPELDSLLADGFADKAMIASQEDAAEASPDDDDDEDIVITCTCCGSTFPDFYKEQAHRYASDLIGEDIYGHYDSSADTDHFRFRVPHAYQDGIVWDACIVGMARKGMIEGPEISEMNVANALQFTTYLK